MGTSLSSTNVTSVGAMGRDAADQRRCLQTVEPVVQCDSIRATASNVKPKSRPVDQAIERCLVDNGRDAGRSEAAAHERHSSLICQYTAAGAMERKETATAREARFTAFSLDDGEQAMASAGLHGLLTARCATSCRLPTHNTAQHV